MDNKKSARVSRTFEDSFILRMPAKASDRTSRDRTFADVHGLSQTSENPQTAKVCGRIIRGLSRTAKIPRDCRGLSRTVLVRESPRSDFHGKGI